MDYKVIDIHSHIVPNFDDGSTSLHESWQMLRLYEQQNVTDIFCTSHSGWGIEDYTEYKQDYITQFEALRDMCKRGNININVHPGCEILTLPEDIDNMLNAVENGSLVKLGNSNCLLVELFPYVEFDEAELIIKKVLAKGYQPIIAHMERNINLTESMVDKLVKMGALIQINAFSFVDEKDERIKSKARNLLQDKNVHFIGSDAHRITHRPPNLTSGVEYVLANCDKDYASAILCENAKKMLI